MMYWIQFSLQESNSPYMNQLNSFHDLCLILCLAIMILITYLLLVNSSNTYSDYTTFSSNKLEMVWAILPILVLILIAFPSLWLLYKIDEDQNMDITVKVIGSQWFWSYEYSDFKNFNFNSYMKPWINPWDFRLLDVDYRLILPYEFKIRLLVTASDVLHSWTVPSLGVKIDAVPNRLNQTYLLLNSVGLFYGQCSEICGINHSFMPICIESQNLKYFMQYLQT
uniref:Cytochrome c oxidase subunit 2 n=1 Tax=Bisetocreagris titanium TaxID=2836860 RepID=A0A8F7PV75_9ARAC|nr:cytochrome c oxidase subunit II [Bisetocreagris titanium]